MFCPHVLANLGDHQSLKFYQSDRGKKKCLRDIGTCIFLIICEFAVLCALICLFFSFFFSFCELPVCILPPFFCEIAHHFFGQFMRVLWMVILFPGLLLIF